VPVNSIVIAGAGLTRQSIFLEEGSFLMDAWVNPTHDGFAGYLVNSANAPFQLSGGGFFW
jgi:hypothetical protein